MKEISRIGLDLAKTVFQVHGVNAREEVVVRRSLRRSQLLEWFSKLPPCLVGMEACATAHHWARELSRFGHTVRLIPPCYAKAYVRRNKNDAAICEAVSRPSMRFVPAKTEAQQAAAGIHRVREALIKQQTATMNALRGLMAEFGIFAAKGHKGMDELLAIAANLDETRIPEPLRAGLVVFATMLETLEAQLRKVDKALVDWGRSDKSARRLCAIPGYGVVTATALAARVVNPHAFDSGRHFAASLGLVPRQDGTGGKVKLGPISKRGDGYLRKLLVNGAMAVLRSKQAQQNPWLKKLLQTKPMKVVAVALANKNARIGWAMLIRQEDFRPRPAAAA